MRYGIITIEFDYETRIDDILDEMWTNNIGYFLESNDYWGSETDLYMMSKVSTYVLQYKDDVKNIVEDYLYALIDEAITRDADMHFASMDEREARECGYVIGTQF